MIARALRICAIAGALVLPMTDGAAAQGVTLQKLSFAELPGWRDDPLNDTLSAFGRSCRRAKDARLTRAGWSGICAAATKATDPRRFFEQHFVPVRVTSSKPAMFTGYYEPELLGSRSRGGPFQYPIYRKPAEVSGKGPWRTRAEIENGAVAGRGLELAWLTDPVEAYFLQVQGSGRIRLAEGGVLRAGFSASNGHAYKSIGSELVRRGVMNKHQVSAQRIKAWVRENPTAGRALLHHNPRFIFFREVTDLPPSAGPIGAMSVPLTALRSLAVDPRYIPLGSPIWVSKGGADPLQRLMIAQDVGVAIKGPHRGDIFYGSGSDAGQIAGRTKHPGEIYLLLPAGALAGFAPKS